MPSNDQVDFHSKFILYDERNNELLQIGLSQRKMMIIFLILLGIVFIVLVTFSAVQTKDIRDLRDFIQGFYNR